MYERFSDEARRAMQLANQVAMRYGHQFIAPEAILLGVLAQGCLTEFCVALGVAPDMIKVDVEDALGKMPLTSPMSVAKRVIENACEESRALRHRSVSTHHLLLGILTMTETAAAQALQKAGLTADRLREELAKLFPQQSAGPESPPIDNLSANRLQPYRNHPEVQALLQQIESFQQQQEAALANQDFRAAAQLRDQKVEARIKLRALLDRLRDQEKER